MRELNPKKSEPAVGLRTVGPRPFSIWYSWAPTPSPPRKLFQDSISDVILTGDGDPPGTSLRGIPVIPYGHLLETRYGGLGNLLLAFPGTCRED